jgi:hypothetical protein
MARKQLADAVALVGRGCVARVFAPGLALLFEEGAEVGARDAEQWTQDRQASHGGARAHAGETGGPRAAQETLEDRLGLVVGVMGENDAVEAVPGAGRAEKFKPDGAEARGAIGREGWETGFDLASPGERETDTERRAQLRDKKGVGGAFALACFVIEMDGVAVNVGVLQQQMKQRDAVRPAAYADSPVTRRNRSDGVDERVAGHLT